MKFCPVCGTEYADEIRFCQRDGQTLRASSPGGDLVGQVIADRYHISRKLGEGGMGAVYLAEHVKMGRMSAIKVMGTGMSHDPEAISRFNREAANASRINHPNVCAVYDFGETGDGIIYLAMEFVEGRTLSAILKETGPLPLPRAVGLLRQAADALQAAHDLGIVHRDLKPDNIMIVEVKGREVVKVVDFGIAKAAGGEAGQKVTKTGLVVGTPEYMSPEQLSGDKVDGRSDIYSLGLVFYRMITDRLPFLADTAQETMIKRLTDEPIPLASARPDSAFPPALQNVMNRALARWPQERYSSAGEFAADAARAIEGVTPLVTTADTEAKTQVVRPADITSSKTAPVPRTRVSSPRLASTMGPVTVGVAVVVLALAGGGYVMRDTLFGNPGDTLGADSGAVRIGPDTGVQQLAQAGRDSNVFDNRDTSSAAPSPNRGPTGTQSPGTSRTPRIDSGRPEIPPAKISVALPDIEEIFAVGTRADARRRAETVYHRADVRDSLRAEAASLVGQAYSENGDFESAKDWHTRANRMFPRQTFRNLIADAQRNIDRTSQPRN